MHQSYLSWLAKSAFRAEELEISAQDPQPLSKEYPLLPSKSLHGLLTRLSTCSPKLRRLWITSPQSRDGFDPLRSPQKRAYQRQGYIWHHWAETLQLMRQVEHLHLSVEFIPISDGQGPRSFCTPPQDFFKGMALQVEQPLHTPMRIFLCLD